MKKIVGFICLIFILTGSTNIGTTNKVFNSSNTAHAASSKNIQKVPFDLIYHDENSGEPILNNYTPIYSQNNTTLIPVRIVSESLDCNIQYDSLTKEIDINNKYPELKLDDSQVLKSYGVDLSKENINITLKLNNKTAVVNDEKVKLTVAPTLINGVTYVPTRFVSEVLGYYVYFDEDFHGDYNIYIEKTPLLEIEKELEMIERGNFNREVYISGYIGYILLDGKYTGKGIGIGSTMEQVINAYGIGQRHSYNESGGASFMYFSRGYLPASDVLSTLHIDFNKAGIVTDLSIGY